MDYNQYQSGNNAYPPRQKTNAMAIASLVMGILAIITLCTVYLPLVFGSLSIIFAILSKGDHRHMSGFSYAGIITSVTGIVLSVVTIIAALFMLFTNPDFYQEYKKQLNDIFTQQYGISYDEWMEEYEESLFPSGK